MSLPSNSVEQNDVEQDFSDVWSKVGDEAQSTTLTNDIIQKLDCSEEVDKGDKKKASTSSSSTKKWIQKIPTKVLSDLTTKEKLDVFKYLNFNQLISFQKINCYFNNFINENKDKLPCDYLNIKIVDELAMEQSGSFSAHTKIDIKVKSYDTILNYNLKKKWELAVSERIPLFLSFNESCEAVINLWRLRPAVDETALYRDCNLNLKLPLVPKNIEEMCIVRYWLERLFRCGYERAEFDNIIFNPVLIELLFENEVKELNTKQTTLRYCIGKFESEGMKFVKDHLKIFDKFSVEFTLCNNTEKCNGIILDILNDGARFDHVCILTNLRPSIFELIRKKITTSTNCSFIVSNIEFKVSNWGSAWNFNYLHNREGVETRQFIKGGEVRYSSSYEIANTDNPNIVFLINYVGPKSVYGDLEFKIKRK